MLRKTLHAINESKLASYQARQVGNTCSFHAIAVALRLLLDYEIDPIALSEKINDLWWRGRFMRVAPNWAVTPRMQVRIVHFLAKENNLPISAFYKHGNLDMLPASLTDPNAVSLITLLWFWGGAPPIYLGDTDQNYNSTNKIGGHTMILAAHDLEHRADGQFFTPWGFINPWRENTKQLFWMSTEDFRKAWGVPLLLIGPNPQVVIQKLS